MDMLAAKTQVRLNNCAGLSEFSLLTCYTYQKYDQEIPSQTADKPVAL